MKYLNCLLSFFIIFCFVHCTSEPLHTIESKVILKNDLRRDSADYSIPHAIGLYASDYITSEIEVLRSLRLIENAVKEQNLYIRYFLKGRFNEKTELFGKNNLNLNYKTSPIKIYLDDDALTQLKQPFELKMAWADYAYLISGQYGEKKFNFVVQSLPTIIETPIGSLLLHPDKSEKLIKGNPVYVEILPPLSVAKTYYNNLRAELVSETTNIVKLSLDESNEARGAILIDQLVELYNDDAVGTKNVAAILSTEFIDDRLSTLEEEIQSLEAEVYKYRPRRVVLDYIQGNENDLSEKENIKKESQLELISYFQKELAKRKTRYDYLPPVFSEISTKIAYEVEDYNKAISQRVRLLKTAEEDAPIVLMSNQRIQLLIEGLQTSVNQLRSNLISLASGENPGTMEITLNNEMRRSIVTLSQEELDFIKKNRTLKVKTDIYTFLQQKKEEISIIMAVTVPPAKILDPPTFSNKNSHLQ